MKLFKNYIGQLRLYSLVDLTLLLVAIGTPARIFVGAIILHIAFLAYLESRHSHSNRARVPRSIAYGLGIIGLVLYGKVSGLLYVVFSFLYPFKINKLGFMSPIFRGLQNLFMIGGILGYHSPITYVAGIVLFLRNLMGDFRDIEKDKEHGMKTIPILFGWNKNIKHIHLISTIITSCIWWYISPLSIIWLLVVIIIEIGTYNLTPR